MRFGSASRGFCGFFAPLFGVTFTLNSLARGCFALQVCGAACPLLGFEALCFGVATRI